MNNESPLRFAYKLPAANAILMVLVVIAVTLSMVFLAQSNPDTRLTRSLARIFSPIELPVIYWGMAVLCSFATIYVLFISAKMSKGIRYVELGSNGVFVPSATMSMTQITIPYKAIRGIQILSVQKHKLAIISSSVGESRLSSQCFSTPGDFTTFLSVLEQRNRG